MGFRVGKHRGIRLNNPLKKLFVNRWVELASRWILGLTFIYASYHKIIAPEDFAKIIYGYDLFPQDLINLIAIILPFLELVSGLFLILGIYPRSAVLIVNGMLFTFIIVLSVNLIRGHQFDCGCFSAKSTAQPSSAAPMLVRDILYFAIGLQIFLYKGIRKLCVYNQP